MCPSDMKPYERAFILEQEFIDNNNWTLGVYVESAVSVAIEHCLAGNKARSKYVDKPFTQISKDEKRELSEEEKLKRTELLFTALSVQKANWDLNK